MRPVSCAVFLCRLIKFISIIDLNSGQILRIQFACLGVYIGQHECKRHLANAIFDERAIDRLISIIINRFAAIGKSVRRTRPPPNFHGRDGVIG
jgi:hypothetical protein